jgi:hypothetical protein
LGVPWAVKPVPTGADPAAATGYCYLAADWRICIVGSLSDVAPEGYGAYIEHAPTGLEWLAQLDAAGELQPPLPAGGAAR